MKVRIQKLPSRRHNGPVSYEWDSLEDFMVDLEELKVHESYAYNRIAHDSRGESWRGCATFAILIDHLRNGWQGLHEQMTKMMEGIELDLPIFPTLTTQRRRKRSRDDHGDSIDMTRVWNGQLDTAWDRPKRVEKVIVNTKRVTLVFNVAAWVGVKHSEALWRAALATLLSESLVKAGRTLEIWAIHSSEGVINGPTGLWRAWCVKRAHDPLSIDRLCSMTTVGFARTCGFLAAHCGPYTVRPSYGHPATYGLSASLEERRELGETVIRIDDCFSREQVIEEYKRVWAEVEQHAAQAA